LCVKSSVYNHDRSMHFLVGAVTATATSTII
jgi:hypothetical protein